jgi:hypothetical protein
MRRVRILLKIIEWSIDALFLFGDVNGGGWLGHGVVRLLRWAVLITVKVHILFGADILFRTG